MSKRLRNLIITSVALLLVIGLLVALLLLPDLGGNTSASSSSNPASAVDTSVSLIDKSVDADGKTVEEPITRVEITPAEGEAFVVENDAEDGLRVAAYADFIADTTKLNNLVMRLKTISATRLVKEDAADVSVYKLDEENATAVTVTYYDGTQYAFYLGMSSPGEAGRYFRQVDSNDVYLVSAYLGSAVDTNPLNYISHTLITAPAVNTDDMSGAAMLRNMELSGTLRPQTVYFRKATENDSKALQQADYVITKPALRGMEDSIVQQIVEQTSLTAASIVCLHPTQEQIRQYGLEDPYSVAVFDLAVLSSKTETGEDGTQTAVPYYYNVQSHTVKLGGKDENGYYYALVDDLDMVVTLMPSAVLWAEQTYDTLVDPLLFMQMIADMRTISITTADGHYDFKLTHFPDETDGDLSMTVSCNDVIYSTPYMRKFYQVLMSIQRIGPATAEVPEGAAPALVVELTPIEGSQGQYVKAELYKMSGSVYLCRQANGDLYQVTARAVNHALEQLSNYLNGEPVTL